MTRRLRFELFWLIFYLFALAIIGWYAITYGKPVRAIDDTDWYFQASIPDGYFWWPETTPLETMLENAELEELPIPQGLLITQSSTFVGVFFSTGEATRWFIRPISDTEFSCFLITYYEPLPTSISKIVSADCDILQDFVNWMVGKREEMSQTGDSH